MAQKDHLIAELKMEAANTKKILERVPVDKSTWKPHAKSMAMGNLATHVSELPSWITMVINTDELNLATMDYKPKIFDNNEALVANHDNHVTNAIAALDTADDALMAKPWVLRKGDHVILEMPKAVVIRNLALNHSYHHRAQLGVYLRLNDVAIPGMYGPSADEMS
jgi:uncharacterized damage-inducible protein DinB